MTKKKKYQDDSITVRLPKNLSKLLKASAEKMQMSVSDFLRDIIRDKMSETKETK
jgi:hypothetical protein